MIEHVQKILEWLHITMVLAMVVPFTCIGQEYGYDLIFRCYIIIIPVIVSEIAARKCKHMSVYLFFSLSSVILLFKLAQKLQPDWSGDWYVAMITLEGLIVVIIRMAVRIKLASKRQVSPNVSMGMLLHNLLMHPSVLVLGYFFALYIVGTGFFHKVLCNAAFWSTLLYIFLLVIYTFLKKAKDYLFINRDVHRLPMRRIYIVWGNVVAFLLLLILLVAFFAFMLGPVQQPKNTEKMPEETVQEKKEEERERDRTERYIPGGNGGFVTVPESTQSFKGILTLACVVVFGGVIVFVFREILGLFSNFRKSYDENGDKIELLVDEEPVTLHSIIIREVKEPEVGSIRRKYRRMIRKNRKDIPDVSESPFEIEKKAGLVENEEMQQLHVEYEAVRYGKRN